MQTVDEGGFNGKAMRKRSDTIFVRNIEVERNHYDICIFFSSMPTWALFILVLVFYTMVVGLGVFIGHQKFIGNIKVADMPLQTAVAAIFGLLAFILGFTFSITWSRFVTRNSLVIGHAEAIEVCYRRTSLITETQKNEVRKLLYEYATILTKIPGEADFDRTIGRIDEIHSLIWQQTASLPKEDIDSEMRSLFVSSVNETMSRAMERKTVALVFHIPDAIWGVMLFLGFVGMLAFGYQAGISGVRTLIQLPWLPVAFGLVTTLISDLDSTGSQRHFKVSHQPLRDLVRMMEKDLKTA